MTVGAMPSYCSSMPGMRREQDRILCMIKYVRSSNLKMVTRKVLTEKLLLVLSNPQFLEKD